MAIGRTGGRTATGLAGLLGLAGVAAVLLWARDAGAQTWTKRGYADTGANYDRMQALNSGWYYRWSPDKPNLAKPFDAQFVPMIWGGSQANNSTINKIKGYGDTQWVLGFNEPERTDQANLSVAQAISAWQTMSTGFAGTGIKLVSPAVADTGGATGGQAWLSSFMSQANTLGLQVDAVAFHWYGVSTPNDPVGAANSFISRVDSYHNTYNKPVWITEFAIHDWGNAYTDQQIADANRIFLDNVIPRLDSRSYVAGYSWYQWFGDSTLVAGNPLTPTNLGETWVETYSAGETLNVSGQTFGEHVAYLGGGSMNFVGRTPGSVRYVHALEGTSTFSAGASWELQSGGWLRVEPGATLVKTSTHRVTLNSTTTTNNGIIDVNGGELRFAANCPVDGTGKIILRAGAVLGLDGGGTGRTQVNINQPIEFRGGTVEAIAQDHLFGSGGTLFNSTTFQGAGNLTINGALVDGTAGMGILKQGAGKLTLAGDNSYTGATQVDEGTLILRGTTGFGTTTIGPLASLEGSGTVRDDLLVQSGATVRSNSLHVGGDYTQEDGTRLELTLINESLFDQLTVAGNLAAGGTLALLLNPGFVPAEGTAFHVLDFAAFSGGFAELELPELGGGLGWDDTDLASAGMLSVVAVGLPGDYNGDGLVDAADYTVWRDSVGQEGSDLAADGDHNQHVDELDYNLWKTNFGRTADDPQNAASESTAVPEPASLILALAMLTCACLLPSYGSSCWSSRARR
jgi:autotransporter-associated beta strand protein